MVLETMEARRSILFQFKQNPKKNGIVNNNSIATFFSHAERYEISQEPCIWQ